MFNFISAGVTPNDLACNIWVVYEKNEGPFDVTEDNPHPDFHITEDKEKRLTIAKCPDRTLYITCRSSSWYPDFEVDEYVSPNIYEHHSPVSKYCDYILFSAHNCKQIAKQEIPEWNTNKDLTVVIDSGGAQLRFGTAKYVDPDKVIAVYNKGANIGMALDIPPRPCDKGNKPFLKALAVGQRKNTEIFKKKADKTRVKDRSLRFLNTLHGFCVDDYKMWIKETDDKFFDGWAVGWDANNDYMHILAVLMPKLYGKKGGNNHIHIFGVSSLSMLPVMGWFGKHIESFTSDSSQHIHTAIRAKLFENFVPTGKKVQYKMGTRESPDAKGKVRVKLIDYNSTVEVPCGCPICAAVKYSHLYTLDSTTGMSNILSAHNIINNAKRTKWWAKMALRCDVEQYCKLIKDSYRKSEAKEIIGKIKFIEYIMKHGADKAIVKYKDKLNQNQPILHTEIKSFFGHEINAKKAAMENLKYRDSAVLENLPNYMDYKDLKHIISEDEYKTCKLDTIYDLFANKTDKAKKNDIDLEDVVNFYSDNISLKAHEFLLDGKKPSKSDILKHAGKVSKKKNISKKKVKK